MRRASRSTWPSICGPAGASRGTFCDIPYRSAPVVIDKPNEYRGFPIRASDDELTQTLVVRINGSVDDPASPATSRVDNYVITEDHYIEYLTGGSAEALIPAQILTRLRDSHCLFLGYPIRGTGACACSSSESASGRAAAGHGFVGCPAGP